MVAPKMPVRAGNDDLQSRDQWSRLGAFRVERYANTGHGFAGEFGSDSANPAATVYSVHRRRCRQAQVKPYGV